MKFARSIRHISFLTLVVLQAGLAPAQDRGEPWERFTVDDTSRGADGARLADVNGDGLLDIATGWEEGGVVRAYLHPGVASVTKPWPRVTVGEVKSPEDAVFVDLDGDGAVDVVSCCEGNTRAVFVHWAPSDRKRYLDASAWKTERFPVLVGFRWMFCVPMDIDEKCGIDLVLGSKGRSASVGWLESPEHPRQLADWKYHRLYDAGWIMSIIAVDLGGDGRDDLLISDRKGKNRGCLWLERPAVGSDFTRRDSWRTHRLDPGDREVMFIDHGKIESGGSAEILAALRGYELMRLDPKKRNDRRFIKLPPDTGTAKSARIADINLDGRADIVFSCENSAGKSGVLWLEATSHGNWKPHEISGVRGKKFDLLQLIDIDRDGDLDVLTCEESESLGVIWYRNPARSL